jgi:hypothetical protein
MAEEDFEGAFVSGHFLNREVREEREESLLKIFANFALLAVS